MPSLYQRILCPVDFSSQCIVALKKAAELSEHFNAPLTLAHIINNPWSELYKPMLAKMIESKEEIRKAYGYPPKAIPLDVMVERVALPREGKLWLIVRLGGELPEIVPPRLPFRPAPRNPSLLEALSCLEAAADDPRIAGVLLRFGEPLHGLSGAPD